jgi:hypothetical protein
MRTATVKSPLVHRKGNVFPSFMSSVKPSVCFGPCNARSSARQGQRYPLRSYMYEALVVNHHDAGTVNEHQGTGIVRKGAKVREETDPTQM